MLWFNQSKRSGASRTPVRISRLDAILIAYSVFRRAASSNTANTRLQTAAVICIRSLTRERAVPFLTRAPFVTARNKQKQQLGHTKEKRWERWWQADNYSAGEGGNKVPRDHEGVYVLSRPGSVRSVDRSRGSRLKGVRLRQDRARRRRGRRAGIPVEGVVDESGLRHTLAAVPESASFMQCITRGNES